MEVALHATSNTSLAYMKKCKKPRILDILNMGGVTFKDLKKLLSNYHGSIITNTIKNKLEK